MYFLSGKAASPTKKYGRVRPPSGSGPGKHKVSLSKAWPKVEFAKGYFHHCVFQCCRYQLWCEAIPGITDCQQYYTKCSFVVAEVQSKIGRCLHQYMLAIKCTYTARVSTCLPSSAPTQRGKLYSSLTSFHSSGDIGLLKYSVARTSHNASQVSSITPQTVEWHIL